MPRKLNHAVTVAWLLGISFILLGIPAFAEPPAVEDVLIVLGMDKAQIAKLAQGQPIAYALSEGSDDELGLGVVWYLPVPLAKVVEQLRLEDTGLLDVDVTAHGLLTEHGGSGALAPVVLSKEDALALLDAEPGDEFNLSIHEIDSFKGLNKMHKRTSHKAIEEAVRQHYREILYQRFRSLSARRNECDSDLCAGGKPGFKAFLGTAPGGKRKRHPSAIFSSLVQGMAKLPESFAAGSERSVPLGGKNRGKPVGNHPKTPHQY